MSRSNSPLFNYVVRDRFRSKSRSHRRLNGFKNNSKSVTASKSPIRNRFSRKSPVSRSPLSRSPRSPKRYKHRTNRTYSRSLSHDYSHRLKKSYSRSRSPKIRRKYVGSRENPTPSNCIGIFGLSKRTEEKQLWEIFEKYGHIKSIQLVMDKYSRMSQGFGFIYFSDIGSATHAKAEGNGMEIDGKVVRIDFSITRKAHTPTPGVYMGRKSTKRRGRYEDRDNTDDRYHRSSYGRREYSYRRRSRSRSRSPYRRPRSRSYGSYPRRDR